MFNRDPFKKRNPFKPRYGQKLLQFFAEFIVTCVKVIILLFLPYIAVLIVWIIAHFIIKFW